MTPFGVRQFRRLLLGCVSISFVGFALATMGSVLAGHFLGEPALAGVALAAPVLTFANFMVALVGNGTGINYSLRRGRLDREGANAVFMQGVWTMLAGALVAALAVWGFRDAIIGLMTSDPEIAAHAAAFWRWLPFVLFFTCASGVLTNCCYCDGDTAFATAVSVGNCIVALSVSLAALRGGLGAGACSLGLAVGQLCACVALAFHFVRRSNTFRFRWRFSVRDSLVIVRTTAGDALGFLGDVVVYFLLGCVLSRAYGPAALLGMPVYAFITELLGYVNGFASAMQPIVAGYYGAGNLRSVRTVADSVFRLLIAVSLGVSAVLLLFPGMVLAAVGIDEPSLVAMAKSVVRITAVMIVPMMTLNLLNNYYQLIERPQLAVAMTLVCWILLPAAAILGFAAIDERGFWYWSAAARWGGAALVGAWLLVRYGRGALPFLLDRDREGEIDSYDLRLRELDIAVTAERVANRLLALGIDRRLAMRARLLVEETLMAIRERNGDATVYAEVTLDRGDGIVLTLCDDGLIFDITDADARVSGLRTYLVATMMGRQSEKSNILTTGFNRNVFRLA